MGLQPVVIFTEVRCVVIKKKFPMKYSPRALAGSIGPGRSLGDADECG